MLLDSNILIYGAHGPEPRLDIVLSRTDLAVTSITRIETLGFHRLTDAERHWLEVAIGLTRVLMLDDDVANCAIALRQSRKIGVADAIIAATALVHGLPLVTRNVRDFDDIPGLTLINPFTEP